MALRLFFYDAQISPIIGDGASAIIRTAGCDDDDDDDDDLDENEDVY